MFDLRQKFRAAQYAYSVSHTDVCTFIAPLQRYVNRDVPPQELVAQAFLKADRYTISWRVGCADANASQRCEMLVYLDNTNTPSMMYDLRQYPEYSVAFHLKQSRYVYVALRVQGKTTFMVHTMHVMLARDQLVGYDPLMYEWDMEKVALALQQQRHIARTLTQMYMLFEWDTTHTELEQLFTLWKDVFTTPQPDHQQATGGTHDPSPPVVEHYQNTVMECRVQAPNLLATSRDSLIGSFHCDSHGDWSLKLQGSTLLPTYVHAQYFIWCFPDKQIKFALRRDTPVLPDRIDFTLQGNDRPQTPIWFWLGYNFVGNLPFYNLWSVVIHKLEFVNREDLLALFEQVEDHFTAQDLQPETNLYGK